MTKFRYFLISIAGGCLIVLILSISGVWQLIVSNKKRLNPSENIEDSTEFADEFLNKIKRKKRHHEDFSDANQVIHGLYLPSYDSSGNESSIIRSEYAALFEDKIYKIKKPTIEFKNLSGKKDDLNPNDMIITANDGILDIETNIGTLTGNVKINFDNDMQLNTTGLSYLRKIRRIYTNDDVSITDEKMIIHGRKFEVSLANSKAWIKENVRMELKQINADSLFNNLNNKKENSKEKSELDFDNISDDQDSDESYHQISYVKADGELVFDLITNAITFYNNAHAVVGEMTIFADQLKVLLESKKRKISEVAATGNVLVIDKSNILKGDLLIWDSATGVTSVADDKTAEFLNDTALISAKQIRLYQDNNWVEVPSTGRLITKSDLNILGKHDVTFDEELDFNREDLYRPGKIDKQNERESYRQEYLNKRQRFVNQKKNPDNKLIITWKGKMLFKNDEQLAIFEKDVEVVKAGSKLNCEELEITFNKKNAIQSLTASGNVNIIEQKEDYKSEIEADIFTWSANDKPAELEGKPFAKVKLGNKQLSSPKILVFDNGKKILANDNGNLTIAPDDAHGDYKADSGYIYLEWQGHMEFKRDERKASFYENIQAIKQGMNIRCDIFDVHFDENEQVKKIVAIENVYISSDIMPNLEGLGTMLTWDVLDNVAILTGDPVAELRKEGSRTLSKTIYFDIKSKQVTWDGRSQWQIMQGDVEKTVGDATKKVQE